MFTRFRVSLFTVYTFSQHGVNLRGIKIDLAEGNSKYINVRNEWSTLGTLTVLTKYQLPVSVQRFHLVLFVIPIFHKIFFPYKCLLNRRESDVFYASGSGTETISHMCRTENVLESKYLWLMAKRYLEMKLGAIKIFPKCENHLICTIPIFTMRQLCTAAAQKRSPDLCWPTCYFVRSTHKG